MGKLFKLLFLIALLGGAYAWMSPYLAVRSLTQALENEDPAKVARHVDFDAVKASLQDDFAERMGISTNSDSLVAKLTNRITGAFIGGIVSPETMVGILKDKDRRDHMGLGTDPGALIMRGKWHGTDRFVLHDDHGRPTALLAREGIRWKVVALRIN